MKMDRPNPHWIQEADVDGSAKLDLRFRLIEISFMSSVKEDKPNSIIWVEKFGHSLKS